MQITRTSIFTGITRTREIAVTQAQIDAWKAGELIQRAMPHLSNSDREFIIAGCTDEEWDEAFAEDEDEDDPDWEDLDEAAF